jgi:hypothetical protein
MNSIKCKQIKEFLKFYMACNMFVVYESEFLAANPEVPGSIPGATRFSE